MRFALPSVMTAIPSATLVIRTSAFIGTSLVARMSWSLLRHTRLGGAALGLGRTEAPTSGSLTGWRLRLLSGIAVSCRFLLGTTPGPGASARGWHPRPAGRSE